MVGTSPISWDQVEDDQLTERIIGCAFTVANSLGIGFLEKLYENALAIELREQGLNISRQRPISVRYRDIIVGEYTPDLLVQDRILVELKVVKALNDQHIAQCTNYLRAANKRLCLLMNFGLPRIEIRRVTIKAASA
jgi:GxxExxY protein